MPKEATDKTELTEAARVMVQPEPGFVTFMAEAIEAAERFAGDAKAPKPQNEEA